MPVNYSINSESIMSENKLLKTEVFQKEMVELEDCFDEMAHVYDLLAEKICRSKDSFGR